MQAEPSAWSESPPPPHTHTPACFLRAAQIAGVTAPEASMLVIQPYDISAIPAIEKAIMQVSGECEAGPGGRAGKRVGGRAGAPGP